MRSRLAVLALVILAGLVAAATASARGDATDYADTALNIIPSGQYGGFPIVPEADDQAKMYDDLTPLFDDVTEGDLTTYFKSEALSDLGTDGPGTVEPTPNPDVTIVRDSFNVPHITADDEEDGIWAAGWLIAEDRGLLIQQARFNARVASIDAPGLSAIGLVVGFRTFSRALRQRRSSPSRRTRSLLRAKRASRSSRTLTPSSPASTPISTPTAPRPLTGRATTFSRSTR